MYFDVICSLLALLGSALMSGCFFAFSSFVMESLARRPAPEGIAAMQSINEVVLNRSFLGTFLGTAALSLTLGLWALLAWHHPQAPLWLAGSLFYLLGTFLVTVVGNVPLNEALARHRATDEAALLTWRRYLERWTRWNHLRTLCALAATGLYALALLQLADRLPLQKHAQLQAPISGFLLSQLPAPNGFTKKPHPALP